MFEKMMKSWSIVQHGASLLVATALLASCASVAAPSAIQSAGQLGRADAVFHSVGAALQWDWLDAGRISARAGREQAWHSFEQTVLNALADSKQALRQWSASQATPDESLKAEAAVRAVTAYTRVRVAAGMEPPNLEIDQSLGDLRARRASLTPRTEALNAFTKLQLALGAWQP